MSALQIDGASRLFHLYSMRYVGISSVTFFFFFNYFFELFLEFSVNPSVQVVGLPPSPWERRILGAHVTRTMLLIFKDVHVVA